jgi:hypothetical protein
MAQVTRDALVSEYDRLCRALVKRKAEPVVSDAVLDCFTDAELGLLVKDSALRLSLLMRKESL